MLKPVIIKVIALFIFLLGIALLPILVGIPILFFAADIRDYGTKLQKKILES